MALGLAHMILFQLIGVLGWQLESRLELVLIG